MTLVLLISLVMAIPALIRTIAGDFASSTFYLDIFLDIIIISFAILTRNLVAVVIAEILCNVFINWVYQRKFLCINESLKAKERGS